MQRLASGSLSEVLDQVEPAIAAGAVNVISVEAIRARSGDRWPRKREQVETFVERTFGRMAQTGDLIVALNDAEFLTVQCKSSRTAALGVSATLLKDTLEFFLGAVAREDLRLFEVTAFEKGHLSVSAIEASGAIERAATQDQVEGGSRRSAPPSEIFALGRPKTFVLTASSGAPLQLRLTAEPTWNVAQRVIASYLLQQDISRSRGEAAPRAVRLRELPPNLAGDVAIAAVKCAVEFASEHGAKIGIHAPLPLGAITYSTSRYRLLHALRELQLDVRKSLILEIADLDEGLPPGRLAELVGTLAPHCRAVLARAPSEISDVSSWRRTGLGGVTLDCSHIDPSDRNAQFRLSRFVRGALQVSKACVGYGLRSHSLLLAAWAAGFTHLHGPAVTFDGPVEGPIRLEPADLFAHGRRGAA